MSGGDFNARGDGFARFLADRGRDGRLGSERFVPRNFLLDEGVSAARTDGYRSVVGVPTSADDWRKRHDAFLAAAVAWRRDEPCGRVLDATSGGCPETWRAGAPLAAFGRTAEEVRLVHVMKLTSLARGAGVAPEVVEQAIADWEQGRPALLDRGVLARLARRVRGVQPVFATLWEEVRDLVPDPPEAPPCDWANRLRDRLGLTHVRRRYRRDEGILVFGYEASRIPRLRSARETRALAIPTVLDAQMFAAFCPPPEGAQTGAVVDLSAALDRPKKEVVHPPLRLRAADLLQVGAVTSDPPPLEEARAAHLLRVREDFARDDYGQHTDGDLV